MEIGINKKKEMDDEMYALCVEKIIGEKCIFKEETRKTGSLVEMAQGVFNLTTRRYEVPNEGVITYQTPLILDKYVAIINVEGFNESESEVYQEIKKNLEKVIGFDTGNEAGQEFFPELYESKE